ncbi:DUF3068 domain-containing protein [Gordonia sp. (in: high G+C Gram-positive bacteria)]|uniref:DUF3068 domain-containing protein n=1 Tax=Gordonia sp. (in: high G+C Gram-positive bacteria) TaxID=84139 RepID=UPI0039E277DD
MKRFVLGALAFLGFACLTAAVGTKLFLVPQLRVVPLDLDITSVATTVPADGQAGNRFPATIFDRCSIRGKEAKTLQAHLTQQRRSRIVEPSDRRQATVQSAQTVRIDRIRADGKESDPTMAKGGEERTCGDALLNATIDRVSVNRRTSVPNGAVNSIQTEATPDGGKPGDVSVVAKREGFQYKFGFNVKKRDYLYYDLTTRQDTRAKFVDEKTIDGVKTYHFVTEVPETDLSTLETPQGNAALGTMLTMPARWWGISGKGVKPGDKIAMHRYASSTRHVWVEPKTGTIVDGREDQKQYFKSPDQTEDVPGPVREFTMPALQGTFQWSPETSKEQAARAQKYMNQLRFGQDLLPLILGGVGAVLLLLWALGTYLTRGSKKDAGPDDTPTTVEPAMGEVPDDRPAPAWREESPWRPEEAPGASTGVTTTGSVPIIVADPAAPTTQFPSTYPPLGDQPPVDPNAPTTAVPVDDEAHWHYNQHGQYVADHEDPPQPGEGR